MKPRATPFAENQLLFGRDDTPAIVSAEPTGDAEITVYRRPDDKLVSETRPFHPFLWLPEQVYLQGFDRKVEYVPLAGGGFFKFLGRLQSWTDFQQARKFLGAASYFAINDPAQQYLMATGRTLFKGWRFDQLHRLQIAVVMAADGKLEAAQLGDNRGWQQELTGTETQILKKLVDAIRERDPDVLEGHDVFRGTLTQLAARAHATRVPLKLGRDGSMLRSRQSRVQIAERTIQYPKFAIHGRHIVDTFLLSVFYDVSSRELEGFELGEVAAHFGVKETGTAAVRRISELLSASYFVQAQVFPYNYQDVVVRGNATKIDALFLREYLHRNQSVPQFGEPRPFAGGYTDMFQEGVVRDVWHCDVQSLYPSLMLAFDIKPRGDELGLFLPLLRDLRQFRLKAKADMKISKDETQRQNLDALQQTFKILINSFYGYLGFSQAHFGDFAAAEEVTAKGRETLKTMLEWLQKRGAKVIEIDTDGLYFVPPSGTDPQTLERELQTALPKGVDVEIDGQFPAMFSYKMKNYALLDGERKLHVTGSALRSRGLEKFQRQFLEEMLTLALRGEAKKVPQLYEDYCQKIERGQFPIDVLAKTETLQDTLDAYRQKIAQSARNRSAAYELALKSGRAHGPGDQITYYVTGDSKRVSVYDNCKLASEFNPARRDENIDYYLDKLKALYRKFAEILTGSAPRAERSRNQTPDLFG
ncbi:MAG TPA: DNA polymerase domain-containing protein [Verrucomicrobiae bacterium]|nr:DNA polymerase domain-containing protein [Verrucomicrobiae bacterium]